jgi:hypothetical protein
VLPTEHGGWAFLGEPVLLGLLVAPSWAGAALALAALAGFLARQPLKLVAGDRRRGRRYPRTAAAERALAVLGLAGALALVTAFALAGPRATALAITLTPVAALAAIALSFDLGLRSREAMVEFVAALALGGMATVIARAGEAGSATAFALWGVLAARAISTIPFVRARLRLDRGEPAGIGRALVAQLVAIAVGAALVLSHRAGAFVLLACVLLGARAGWGLSRFRPRLRVALLGVTEIVWGLVTVVLAALAMRAPHGG